MLDVPRLSVDIDVSYIGSISREEMLAERPAIEAGIEAVANADYHPELVFPDNAMAAHAAEVNPEALWKIDNLRKM